MKSIIRNFSSPEHLETRLNLSMMSFHIAPVAAHVPSTVLRSTHSTPKVISLTPQHRAKASVASYQSVPKTKASHTAPAKVSSSQKNNAVKLQNNHRLTLSIAKYLLPLSAATTTTLGPVVPTFSMSTSTPSTAPAATTDAPTSPAASAVTTTAPASDTPASTTQKVDPLAPLIAQLYGDDVHDDSGTIQKIVDTAYQDGILTISLPAGTFKLARDINIYGNGVIFSGQGDRTIFDVANHYNGGADGLSGRGFTVRPLSFGSSYLMVAQPVTGDTIVFRGQADVKAGQDLFLSDGFGTMPKIEQADGGTQTNASFFSSGEPDVYVQVASVTTDANGNTVAHLTKTLNASNQFQNVGPAGTVSGSYLNVTLMSAPASNITMQNFSMKFSDMNADSALYSICTLNLTIKNVHVLNSTPVGALGGIWDCASTGSVFENITSPNGIFLNSSRGVVVQNCQVSNIWLEEASTDNLIAHNTLTGTTTCDLRVNDMACERNIFEYNTLRGGVQNTGAIGINEGTDTTIAFNTITGGSAFIWQGISKGSIIHDNIASALYDYHPIGITQIFKNSWQ